ncbi:MAG: 30S ribosomal protein S7 [Phycisphaerales bacterium]|jgi:small subunit ribosomal protein S7|nr:30S ribosomal protein S7 [Phycisphaerales bacterium]MBT7170604.1 30S ribosomal protein S7 [Phycisphaerales bacterium]
MGRKKYTASAEQLKPDPQFGSKLLAKFINVMMLDGKKWAAQKFMYQALDIISERIKEEKPLDVFEKAIENLKPRLEVRSKRVGGANYQVPMPVNQKRQLSLAMRWLRDSIRAGKGRPTAIRAADEIAAAFRGEGAAMTTRENIHRMAEANKAFAHFAW